MKDFIYTKNIYTYAFNHCGEYIHIDTLGSRLQWAAQEVTLLLISSVRPSVSFFDFMFSTKKYSYFEGNLQMIMIQECQWIGQAFRSQIKKISPVVGDLFTCIGWFKVACHGRIISWGPKLMFKVEVWSSSLKFKFEIMIWSYGLK